MRIIIINASSSPAATMLQLPLHDPVSTLSSDAVASVPFGAPAPCCWRELAAVGPLLWRFTGDDPGDLIAADSRCEARARICNDGPIEWLAFEGRACCGAAYLLPDSDYLAWERLQQSVSVRRHHSIPQARGCEALLARRLRERGGWRHGVFACVSEQRARLQPVMASSMHAQSLLARLCRLDG